MSQPTRGALEDVRVIELAQVLAVPTCGQLLADMGADVIKVEPPRGDSFRLYGRTPVRTEGRGYALFNRGKRSLCLDLTNAESRDVVARLVRSADVVLVSFKPSDLPRYGVDYATLRAIQPRLVYLENTPYGPEGPLRSDGGYDVVAQGLSGLGAITAASENGSPRFVRPAYIDMATGFLSALAVVAALRHRDRTGEGQRVETSLLSSAIALGGNVLHRFHDLDGVLHSEVGVELAAARARGAPFDEQQELYSRKLSVYTPGNIYFRHYRTKDSFLSVGCLSPALNARLRAVLAIEDPRSTAGFDETSPEGREAVAGFVTSAEQLFASRTTDEWLEALRRGGVPCGPFLFPHEVFDDPQVKANHYFVSVDHPSIGRYEGFAPPIRMEATPVREARPSPRLGEHTDEILSEVGLGPAEIAALRVRRVVGPQRSESREA